MKALARSLVRGAKRLRGKAEDLALAGALFGGVAAIVAGAWTFSPGLGLITLGLLAIVGTVLRVAGVGGEA